MEPFATRNKLQPTLINGLLYFGLQAVLLSKYCVKAKITKLPIEQTGTVFPLGTKNYMMRKLLVVLLLGLWVAPVFAQVPKEEVLGVVFEQEERMIFIKSRPQQKYKHLGTVKAAKVLPSYKESILIEHMIKRVLKEYPKCDGLIFLDGSNLTQVDVIQFYGSPRSFRRINRKDPPKMDPANKNSVVQSLKGVQLFIQARPKQRFENLGVVYCPKGTKVQKEDERIKLILEEAKKNYKDFDGLIFSAGEDLCKAFVIKLK